MDSDPVVAEIRALREQFAARFNYDLHAIFEYARAEDAKGDRIVVSRPPRRPEGWTEPVPETVTASEPAAKE